MVSASYKMEDMYAQTVSIDALPSLYVNDTVTISGYIRQVIYNLYFQNNNNYFYKINLDINSIDKFFKCE